MLQCPRCKSGDLRRSRSRSVWERWRRHITSKRISTCNACRWRGWGTDSGPHFNAAQRTAAARAAAPDPPNLKGTLLADTARLPKALDLDALDESLKPLDDPPDDPGRAGESAAR